jgi:Rps23 Pro-64 3,4-dihydroxylase Tpa1-like proline 4-hydroxylase
MVFYFVRKPQKFTGGALQLRKDDDIIQIEPKHNRCVVFPSFTQHEILEVHMDNDVWEDGRFSINYWFGFK